MLNPAAISLFDSSLCHTTQFSSFTAPLFSQRPLFFSSSHQIQHPHICLRTKDNGTTSSSFCVSALKPRGGKKGGNAVIESEGSDFDDFDDEDEDGGEGEGEEEDGMFVPFEEMKKWLENKPRGFGEGKVYDTSIEDELLEEIEQSRQAQIVNINNLKSNPVKPSPKKPKPIVKVPAPEVIPSGFRVRLTNLPKKKNVHRDLKSAFEGVRGIINISPAVTGNKKTKDPICKGFAFVDFKSEEDGIRFVQTFSKQSVSFGKIQKQIICEMMDSTSSKSVDEQSANHEYSTLSKFVDDQSGNSDYSTLSKFGDDVELTIPGTEEEADVDLNMNYDISEAASDDSDPDVSEGEPDSVPLEDIRQNLETVSISEPNVSDDNKQEKKPARDSSLTDGQKRIRALEKKLLARGEGKKVTKLDVPGKVKKLPQSNVPGKFKKLAKLDVPGSAKRLKVKEKAVLTEVFSKYTLKASLSSKTED